MLSPKRFHSSSYLNVFFKKFRFYLQHSYVFFGNDYTPVGRSGYLLGTANNNRSNLYTYPTDSCFLESSRPLATPLGDGAVCDLSDWRPLLSKAELDNLEAYVKLFLEKTEGGGRALQWKL